MKMSQIDRFHSILEFTPQLGARTNSVARMQALFTLVGNRIETHNNERFCQLRR